MRTFVTGSTGLLGSNLVRTLARSKLKAVHELGDTRAERIFAMHFGTFDLADEPLDEAPQRFRAEAEHPRARAGTSTAHEYRGDDRMAVECGSVRDAAPWIDYAQDALRIHVHASIGRLLIAPALPRFIQQYPGRRVQLSEYHVIGEKEPHDVDAAVCIGSIADSRLIAQQIATIHAVTCAAPEFIDHSGLPATPADLAPTDCIGLLEPGTDGARDWVFSKGRATHSFTPAAPLVFSDSESAMAAAVRGGGYVRVWSFEADQRIASGLLQPVLDGWDDSTWPVSLVCMRDRVASDDIAAFSAFVAGLFPLTTVAHASLRQCSPIPSSRG